MDKLRAMRLFVRVVEMGSFTQVADEYSLAKSLVSKEISRLESSLGARLLQRSTRRLNLTHVGEAYLQQCREILDKLDQAESLVQQSHTQPSGKLKVTASMTMGVTILGEAFAEFMRCYPAVELETVLSDDTLDLITNGFDIGFRAASRSFDSSYVGKPLTTFRYRICASPAYLQANGGIEHPEQLTEHNCFEYSYFRGRNTWPIGTDGGVDIGGTLKANSTLWILEAIKKGLGVGFLPDFVCDNAIQDGEIIEVLDDFPRPELTLYALYPNRQFVPPRVIHCIEFMEQWFKQRRG
ncbi:LysR family transcriptional regulator [Salinivibrio sp. IB574]|uniref:LysR family transcriptional regulator n=1 Tax=Salinivibrio sp. IB574 TaxID=1909444 RepID=UPI0009892FB1|nr:LysR family transcriptional regulator [Salinivibrio sp. IB574]OOF23115.1 LysR family transcriptional regulator [Salinivibrio sp. IB574]